MIDVINFKNLTDEEKLISLSLQGLVNRNGKLLYLDDDSYINYISNYKYISLEEALNKYKDSYKGYIYFEYKRNKIEINIASTLSGVLDYLIYPKEEVKELNNTINLDSLTGNDIDKQRYIFNKYKDSLNKFSLVHQVINDESLITLRDYGIKNKLFTFYTDESLDAREFRKEVLAWADKNIPIYGWTTDEILFVSDISKFGDYIIPSDWSLNHSFLDYSGNEKCHQKDINKLIRKDKHYMSIVVSDGDNVQWLERDFMYSSYYHERLVSSNTDYIMNFTISPTLYKTSKSIMDTIYESSINEYFISGVSGIGYMNPCEFPKEHLEAFCNETSEFMEKSDLKVVTLLDNLANIKDNYKYVLNTYSRYNNIIGGVYEIDPICYKGGEGEIYFSDNHKPFISVRFSFWSPNGLYSGVNDEWIKEMANNINNMKPCINKKEGYTVLNIHPWSTKVEDLNKLISLLDDHIEIIKIDDMINMVKENVKE